MKDIFGNHTSPKEVVLNVYHDERKVQKRWLYHAFCLIPVNNEGKVCDTLCAHRRESTWEKEIHFKDLENTRTENELAGDG